ncbi:hypothetical protein [Pontivivens insulae]|uniref:Uncharacterized protein n=1 Tax=Pontivivens insulae TaxID=1639689 RepID=A0A2R8AEC6_9RHOB|nr:hypothetical protein [Pontivivens insulae]RED14338.1 hypothetical protein DFR53_1695 [Pontivivens insulae]SPF30415.1 hypothetical protein POI8812_02751 [Pontivivens insulae]
MFDLLLNSIMLMPKVFLRTFPVALLVGSLYFGLIFNTSNPLWQAFFVATLTTPYIAIMRLSAMRASLMAIGRTRPATLSNLSRSQLRMAYGNLLPINLVQLMVFSLFYLILVDQFSSMSYEAMFEMAQAGRYLPSEEMISDINLFTNIVGGFSALIAALGFGLMGTPMAVTAANAAEKSPRHDITFGFAHNFFGLFVLYIVAQVLNGIFVVTIALFAMAMFPFIATEYLIYGLVAAVVVYISLYFATTAAGAALSYGQLLDQQKLVREYIQENLAGPQTSPDELRAMRRARQSGMN